MPAALYDYCRKGEHRPIRVGDGVVLPTDRQTQDYLLCTPCEDVLNKGGEKWVADKLATWEKKFPLYDILTEVPPLFDEDGMVVYLAANNPRVEVIKLLHFALGIFWKASVHSWRGDTADPRIELGPYSGKIRKWLLDGNEFPQSLYPIIVVEKPQRAQICLNDPYEGERLGYHTHFFHVPGILFMMALGATVDENVRALAVNNAGNPINVSEDLTSDFERLMAQHLKKSHKTAAHFRAKAKADADRDENLN
jgi:hypothetical protein